MTNEDQFVESLTSWLSRKDYWEQYVWRLNFEKESLTDENVARCYQNLREYLGLVDPPTIKPTRISFPDIEWLRDSSNSQVPTVRIAEVKDFEHVNAISPDCVIPLGPNLTLVYGENGSGKSGVGRLLANACFSRGERELLPNVREPEGGAPVASATFVMGDGTEVEYSIGDSVPALKRYSVFDSKSVLIHLDQSNRVSFTPAQIRIFDKVTATIERLEEMLAKEQRERRVDFPFQNLFIDAPTSPTAVFCRAIDGRTTEADLMRNTSFDETIDGKRITELEERIREKQRLDIPKRKAQLASDCNGLVALKVSLQRLIDKLTPDKAREANALITDILENRRIVATLSTESFDDGVLKTIGSDEWKALLVAAKSLRDHERTVAGHAELEHCLLCHQKLSPEASALLHKYWKFLESKAESELSGLLRKQRTLVDDLASAKAALPNFPETDIGTKVLTEAHLEYISELKTRVEMLGRMLAGRRAAIEALQMVSLDEEHSLDLAPIQALIEAKEKEQREIVDPTREIALLVAERTDLKHKNAVNAVRESVLKYMEYRRWQSKASAVNFPGIRMALTKKRTEFFLEGVARNYQGEFNVELEELGCDFSLTMHASGEQGRTMREYRLDFAKDYSPSQILSEGEQNACALADFLTEVRLDANNCGIIFDDPVTSLDHLRKSRIARRLVIEASRRQVIIFTHDLVFTSQIAKHASEYGIPLAGHWMQKLAGVPGVIAENTTPKLANLASLKKDCQDAIGEISMLGAKERETALGIAFDYLRSCCEALIEEYLFAGTIERHSDHVRVQNLEEMVCNESLALQIVSLHGRASEFTPAHNRSDLQREDPISEEDFKLLWKELESLERSLKVERKKARDARSARKKSQEAASAGW